jgi:hypothetical protein
MMAEAILLDSDVLFDAAEWIGVGKLYKDVPIEVSDACCDARKIPADLQATLPSTAMPVTEFLALLLPGILDGRQKISTKTIHWFSFEPPNCDSSHTLWSHSIPALSFLLELENDYAQNWMNGGVSVLNPLEKSIRFPLFGVTFYREIHRLREAQNKWNSALAGTHLYSSLSDSRCQHDTKSRLRNRQKRARRPQRAGQKTQGFTPVLFHF